MGGVSLLEVLEESQTRGGPHKTLVDWRGGGGAKGGVPT